MASVDETEHPRRYRLSVLTTALVAMATWWGLGLPYSLFAWLLDSEQLRWVLICYAWEVPVVGVLGPVLVPLLWFRGIERRWDETFRDPARVDPVEVAALERALLDFPIRVAWVFLATSLIGYGLGGVQVRIFAETPVTELVKIGALGLATGLIGGLFAFLYLEYLLAPLLQRLALLAPAVPPAGRRIPLYVKVFACSLIMTLTALLLLGSIVYSRGERVLEDELGRRALGEARQLARDLDEMLGRVPSEITWWRARAAVMRLGPSGSVALVDNGGAVLAGSTRAARIEDVGFRPSVAHEVLTEHDGYLVDRVRVPRIVAFASLDGGDRRLVAVVRRADFGAELDGMLRRGAVIFFGSLALALIQGFLFSRRLTRPIEEVTERASLIRHSPGGPWEMVPVRTNDEVGELATTFNQMISQLEEARTDLERRVAEATRNIATLYEVARTITSTLDMAQVIALVAEKTLAALGLPRLVLLWRPPEPEAVVDAFAAVADGGGESLEVEQPVALEALAPAGRPVEVVSLDGLGTALPASVAERLRASRALRLPLVFKDRLLGVVLAAVDEGTPDPDLELAAAVANQAAAPLANAALFEMVRRAEVELRRLSQSRADVQEESLRSLSRELHDGVAQVLTVVNMDLGMIERAPQLEAALRSRLHEAREQLAALLQDVRTMSQVLRPSMLDFGVVPTIHWFVEKFTERTDIAVDVRTPPEETRFPGDIEVMLYRVVQEALTNIAKHARARHAEVELTVAKHEVVLVIADDGVGFEVDRYRRRAAVAGVGLVGMRERVAYFRGSIDIRSRLHAGVRITVRVPLPIAEQPDAPTPLLAGVS